MTALAASAQQSRSLYGTYTQQSPLYGTATQYCTAAQTPFPLTIEWGTIYKEAIDSRLGLGFRFSTLRLTKSRRPADELQEETFIGNINELHASNSLHLRPVITYRLSEYMMLEASWSRVSAKTINFNNHLSDGVIKMHGPTFMVMGQYPLAGYVCPYVGLGFAPWSASFHPDPWWGLGWHTPEEYEEAGSPPNQKGKGPRHMEVKSGSGTILGLGIILRLHRHVDLDFTVRRISVASKASFYRGEPATLEHTGKFTMDHTLYGLAVHGVF